MHTKRFLNLLIVLPAMIWMCINPAEQESQMTSVTDTKKIEVETTVNVTPEAVWKAWTTNEGVQTFFSRYSNVELGFRGPYEILFNGEIGSNDCEILSYVPNEMLSFSWNAPPQFEHARSRETFVVIRFDPIDANSTRVRLMHLGFDEMKKQHPDHADEWDEAHAYFSNAWPYVLNNLKRRFEDGPRWDADRNVRWHE